MICNTNRWSCVCARAADPACANDGVMVPAGAAVTQPCDDFGVSQARLAEIQFPIQQYESGFCPCEALETGTLFPELVG